MRQKILVVGASSGLGRSLSELYIKENHIIGAVGRRKELLLQLQAEAPSNVSVFPLDIAKDDAYEAISEIIRQMGGIDMLILTASIVGFDQSLDYKMDKDIILTNVLGYTAVLNAAFHYFLSKGGGHIVGVTSIAAARGNNKTPVYGASKAFQSSYLESLRLKCMQDGNNIHVTELIPGYIETRMAKGDRLFWVGKLNKAASQAKRAIDGKRRRAFITRRWQMVFAAYRFLPSFVYTYLINSKIKLQKRV